MRQGTAPGRWSSVATWWGGCARSWAWARPRRPGGAGPPAGAWWSTDVRRAAAPDVRARPGAGHAVRSVVDGRSGHGQVVLVVGEAGIGKTRLVGELAGAPKSGPGSPWAPAWSRREAPLAMWQELAGPGRCGAGAACVRRLAGELGRLAPTWRARSAAPPRRLSWRRELERLRLFDAVLRLVEWAASERPVLLVAEDLHRADARASPCARTSAGDSPHLPVLFVLTRQGSTGPPRRRRVAGRPRRPRARRHRDRARPAGRRGGGGGRAQRRGIGRRPARAGGRSG